MFTIVPILVTFIVLILWIKKGFTYTVINPIFYISILHAFYFSYFSETNQYLLEIITISTLGVFIYYAFFLISCFGKQNFLFSLLSIRCVKSGEGNLGKPISNVRYLAFYISLFLFSTFLNSYIYGGLLPAISRFYTLLPVNDVPSFYVTLDKTMIKVAFFLSFVLFLKREYGGASSSTIAICLLFYLLTVFPIGARGNLLSIVIAFLFSKLLYIYRSNSRIRTDIFGLVMIMTFIIMSAIQYNIRSHSFSSDSSSVSEIFDSALDKASGDDSNKRDIPIMEEHLTKIVERYGTTHDFLLGHTFYSMFVNAIPRTYWENKPVGVGRILAYNDGAPKDTNISFAVSYFGEGWVNSGWWGVISFSAFFGFFTGLSSRLGMNYFKSSEIKYVLLGFVYIYSASMFVRGDMLSAWGQVIYPLILVHLLIFLSNKISLRKIL